MNAFFADIIRGVEIEVNGNQLQVDTIITIN